MNLKDKYFEEVYGKSHRPKAKPKQTDEDIAREATDEMIASRERRRRYNGCKVPEHER